ASTPPARQHPQPSRRSSGWSPTSRSECETRGNKRQSSVVNWISNVVRPKIRGFLRREVPENLWVKCPETGQLVFYKDLEANQFVVPSSNYHMRMGASARLKAMFDSADYEEISVPEVPVDPLKFRDE